MNNLNDPPNWNIQPNARNDDGHGSKWNYALLVPMLGLAAFRWIWSRESQKEIEKEKRDYYRKLVLVQKELESKYRDIITENRRTVAHLELELEKEQNRTQSYRNALVSQSHKLVEERRALEQERAKLEQEKQILQHSGAISPNTENNKNTNHGVFLARFVQKVCHGLSLRLKKCDLPKVTQWVSMANQEFEFWFRIVLAQHSNHYSMLAVCLVNN
ncbi:coiled-coil domain-containing protein 127 isoform X2 [Sceloporus undulatus]|uniref:coiled-coil domain-containing protein 127 isoform X2 n=1 Tax=Sceloporus undulatus TaxID=8520 RepID=UPI001C4D5F13|nr:coiled-coil domain-containing protein 127 isoform X2 [Sceloporus undulatus]